MQGKFIVMINISIIMLNGKSKVVVADENVITVLNSVSWIAGCTDA